MSECIEMERLVLARPLGVLEDADSATIERHVAGCERCRRLDGDARLLAAELTLPADEPRDGWSALAERIDADKKRRGLRVTVACSYCKDALVREEAAFCASCLAPHHGECFAEHGRCSAPGCAETRFVEPRVPRPRAPRPRRRRLAALVALGALAIAGVAALAPARTRIHVVAVSLTPDHPLVSIEVTDAPVAAVIHALARETRENIVVQPDVTARITLSLYAASLDDALAAIARLADAAVETQGHTTILVPVPRTKRKLSGDARAVVLELAKLGHVELTIAPEFSGTIETEIPEGIYWLNAMRRVVKSVGDFEIVEEAERELRIVPARSIVVQRVTRVIPLRDHGPAAAAEVKRLLELAASQGAPFKDVKLDVDEATGNLVATGPKPELDRLGAFIEENGLDRGEK